jgi:hypothetical protein
MRSRYCAGMRLVAEPLAHDRVVEELEIVATGAAPADVTAGVLSHAAECAECRSELDELTVLLAAMTVLIPERELNRGRSAGIRSRLMARANADAEAAAKRRVAAAARQKELRASLPAMPGRERITRTAPEERQSPEVPRGTPRASPQLVSAPASPPSNRWRITTVWAMVATLALVFVGAGALVLWLQRGDTASLAAAQISELQARADSLEHELLANERTVHSLAGAEVRIVDLVSSVTGGRPLARLFWDTETNRWTLFAYDLRPPRAGYTYQIWALTAQGRISAGTFLTDGEGHGQVDATVALEPGAVRSVFITEEPAGGSRQPTGRPLAAGAL